MRSGHDADGGHRDVTGGDADIALQPLDGRPQVVVVRQRLAHAHEHDVRHAALGVIGEALGGADHLLDDLARRQLPIEASLARRAEAAAHRTPRLCAHAHGRAIAVTHQHALDGASVVQLPQLLHGVAAVADSLDRQLEPGRQFGRQAGP